MTSSFALYITLIGFTFVVLVNSYCQRPGHYCHHGFCTENQTCECPTSYSGHDCRVSEQISRCAKTCSSHGQCVITRGVSWCYCDFGYWGRDCENKNVTVTCGRHEISVVMHLPSPKAVSLHGHPKCLFRRVDTRYPTVYKYKGKIPKNPDINSPCYGAIQRIKTGNYTETYKFHIEIQTGMGVVAPLDWIDEYNCSYTQRMTSDISSSMTKHKKFEVKLYNMNMDLVESGGKINMYEEFSMEFTPSTNLPPNASLSIYDLTAYHSETSTKIADYLLDGCVTTTGHEKLLEMPVPSQNNGMLVHFAPIKKKMPLFFDYKIKICDGACKEPSCTGEPIPKKRKGFRLLIE